jgi:membrane protease YdiL (CAAX protease family)
VLQFLSMLAASLAAAQLPWPDVPLEVLGQAIGFGLAAMLLAGVRPLRRYCAEELRRPLPAGSVPELAIVSVAKSAVPFAVVGAIVAWAFATGDPQAIPARLRSVDPDSGWARALSPHGLARMVLLSWLVGPVVEELVFRGILYRAWQRQWGSLASLLLTSACFGLCHPSAIASSFIGSIVYICVLHRTGSIRACILVHMAYNVLVSWPLLGRILFTPPPGAADRISTWALPLACLALVAVALPAYLWLSRADARARGDHN